MSLRISIDGYKDVHHFSFACGPQPKERVDKYKQTRIKTRNYESAIGQAAADQIEGTGFERLTGRLCVEVFYRFKGWSRGDVDNYEKSLFDAFNRIVWHDDRQIDFVVIHRLHNVPDAQKDLTEVYVYELHE